MDEDLKPLGTENGETEELQTDIGGQEEKLTQADIDKAVESRLARERRKHNDEISKIRGENAPLRELSEVLKDGGGIGGTPSEQVKILREHYGLTKKQAEDVVGSDDGDTADVLVFVKAERYAKGLNADDVVDEYERVLSIPEKQRSADDLARFEVLAEPYKKIRFGNELNDAKAWYKKENPDADFNELMKDEDLIDFVKSSNLTLKDSIEKFIKLTGKKSGKAENPKSMGSVKDTGGSIEKDYYSPADVEKLTDKDLDNPKIFERVRQSMTKWKK